MKQNGDIFAATDSGVYRSTDNGASWKAEGVASGTYIYRLRSGGGVSVGRIEVMR